MANIPILTLGILIATYIYLKTITNTHMWFCVYLFVASLGNYYNEMYQLGNGLVMADFALVLLVGSYIISHYSQLLIQRKTAYTCLIAVYMLILGLISMNEMGQILRDIKVFMYFFVTFFYCEKNKNDYEFLNYVKNTLLICICFTIFVCGNNFFNNGIQGVLTTGKIDRTFGMGLSEYGLAIFVVILFALRTVYKSVIKKIILWVLICICVVLCIMSYTRSIWIQLAISILLYFVIWFFMINHKLTPNTLIRGLLLFASCIGIICFLLAYLKTNYSALYNVLESRFFSIGDVGTGVQGVNADTVSFRLNDIKKYSDKYFNPRIIIGWGFGDKLADANSGIVENSFLYYSWKYGLVLFVLLIRKMFKRFKKMIYSKSVINIAVFSSLISYLVSGGISGHLNKYYYLPLVAILLSIDFGKYFAKEFNSNRCNCSKASKNTTMIF